MSETPIQPEDYDRVAARVAADELRRAPFMRPPLFPISLAWRGRWYIGGLQPVSVCDGYQVALLTKSSRSQPTAFHDRLVAVSGRRRITADDALDLDGRQHVLAWEQDRVRRLTPAESQRAQPLVARLTVIEVFP
jgi:hypothetical protein